MNRTALLVVDMVRDFTDPKGLVYYPQNREILPRIQEVISFCRSYDVKIIFLQHCNRVGKIDQKASRMRPNCVEGTWGVDIDPMLEVRPEDYIIRKRRYSGFVGTDLDLVLRENEIRNVIITGTKTNCCIYATALDAFYHNYEPYIIRECVATNSETVNRVFLENIEKYVGHVISIDNLKEMTKKNGNDNE